MGPGQQEDALLLEGFRVRMYRSIRDSGLVPVFPLTALVGRLQSGKTSLLRALRGLDPTLSRPYSIEEDWPRDRRHLRAAEQVVCAATFRLGADEREQLIRAGIVQRGTRGLRIGRTYAGALVVEAWNGELDDGSAPNGTTPPADQEALASFARDCMPALLYAEHDSLLPGTVAVDDLAAPSRCEEENGTAALATLLSAVGLTCDELLGARAPRRFLEAGERVRALLADRGVAHDLRLVEERGRLRIFLATGGVLTSVDKLQRSLRYRLTLDLRLAAARAERRSRPVLLLDGPGRAFRGKARPALRAMLEAYVRAGATALYTARLPFDIELQHPEQVLVLTPASEGSLVAGTARDSGPDDEVRAALGITGRTSFRVDDLNVIVEGPSDARILEALDGLLRRSGEPALPPDANLASAGGSHEVAAVVAFLARQGLGVIALLDSDEAGANARSKLSRTIRDDARMGRVEIHLLATAAGLGVSEATIEDLFPVGFYLDVAREVCEHETDALITRAIDGDEGDPSEGNIASRLARAFDAQGQRFPKGKVAEALMAKIAALTSVAELPPGMAPPVRRLMRTLRAAADRLTEVRCRAAL